MIHKKYDVVPSVQNHGLTIRCTRNEAELDKLPAARKEKELADLTAANAQATAKYVARVEDANQRDLHTVTEHGLPLIGPASGDSQNVTAMAHNALAVILDQKLAEIDAKLAQLEASK